MVPLCWEDYEMEMEEGGEGEEAGGDPASYEIHPTSKCKLTQTKGKESMNYNYCSTDNLLM